MTELLTPDICVIGAGAGGLSVAAGAARLGASVVLIEKGEMGGDCLNVGCVPSKTLIASATVAENMRDASLFGVRALEPRVEWIAVQKRIRQTIAAIAPNDSKARYEAMGVRVIRTGARFKDRQTVEAGDTQIRARRFVIATGSSPATPHIAGLEYVRPLTNETVFDLDALPHRLVVLGAGAVGLELAQAFRRLGSETLVLDTGPALAQDDPELATVVLARLRSEGVIIRENVEILRMEPHGVDPRIVLAGKTVEETIDGSHLLLAVGRSPNVENLGLDAAGVRYDKKGIEVDASLRTSNSSVYAVGDVIGGSGSTHGANYHAELVLRQVLFRASAKLRPEKIPRVMFTDPELASVGLTEGQARETHRSIRVLRWTFADNDRAHAEGACEGHLKAITAADGRVLGCGIVGRSAGELIVPWSMAIAQGLKAQDIANTIMPYPSLSEISRRAAFGIYAQKADSGWVRRAVRLLRKFG